MTILKQVAVTVQPGVITTPIPTKDFYLPIASNLCINGTADAGLNGWEHQDVSVIGGHFVLAPTGTMTQSRDVWHLSEYARAIGTRFDFRNPGEGAEIKFLAELQDGTVVEHRVPLVPDIFNQHGHLAGNWVRQTVIFPQLLQGRRFRKLYIIANGAAHLDNIVLGLIYVEGKEPKPPEPIDPDPAIYVRAREGGENLWVSAVQPTGVPLKEGDLWVQL